MSSEERLKVEKIRECYRIVVHYQGLMGAERKSRSACLDLVNRLGNRMSNLK